jgi:hypothetical protein
MANGEKAIGENTDLVRSRREIVENNRGCHLLAAARNALLKPRAPAVGRRKHGHVGTNTGMSTDDVAPILAPYRDRSSNYSDVALFDHLPMTVAALMEMGAGRARTAAWAERYAREHGLRPATAAERDGRRRWRARIDALGRAHVIATSGTRLAGGIGAAAFHAAIRAAYALERRDDDELAAALEAWEREYLDLPAAAAPRSVAARDALALLAAEPVDCGTRGLIVDRMAVAGAHPRFAAITAVVPTPADLDTLALAAAAAFAISGNFTALHVMTGTHAMRTLAPSLADAGAAMPGFWRAFAAAALVAQTVPLLDASVLSTLRAEAPSDWAPLLAVACTANDEHVIKATYTAWRLDRDLNDPVYRAAAARYLTAAAAR